MDTQISIMSALKKVDIVHVDLMFIYAIIKVCNHNFVLVLTA